MLPHRVLVLNPCHHVHGLRERHRRVVLVQTDHVSLVLGGVIQCLVQGVRELLEEQLLGTGECRLK